MISAKKIVLFSALTFMMSIPCFAQDVAPVELSFGYNFLRVAGDEGEKFPAGWYGEIAGNLGSTFALVGQFTGNNKSIGIQGIDADVDIHTIGGGIRFTGRGQGAAAFGQVLIGVVRTSASLDVSGRLPFIVSDSSSDGFLQLGAGINLLPGAPVGVRIGGDYIRVGADVPANVLRFAIGLVIPIGR
jgi:hypothetical protein